MNLLIIASALLAATVTSKNLEEVYSDEKVVTAVSFDGLATTEDLKNATPPDYETVKSNAASALSKAEANENTLATKANAADVYTTKETYSINQIDTKIANSTPDYANVKKMAYSALQTESDPHFSDWRDTTNTLYVGQKAKGVAIGANTFGYDNYLATIFDADHILIGSSYSQGTVYGDTLADLLSNATPSDYANVKANASSALSTANDVKAMISATDKTFSNAVLAVGLNIDTNAVAQINELLTDGAKLPTSGVATVGGLLAALAAGLAALKKSVSSLSSKVDDANAALEEVA